MSINTNTTQQPTEATTAITEATTGVAEADAKFMDFSLEFPPTTFDGLEAHQPEPEEEEEKEDDKDNVSLLSLSKGAGKSPMMIAAVRAAKGLEPTRVPAGKFPKTVRAGKGLMDETKKKALKLTNAAGKDKATSKKLKTKVVEAKPTKPVDDNAALMAQVLLLKKQLEQAQQKAQKLADPKPKGWRNLESAAAKVAEGFAGAYFARTRRHPEDEAVTNFMDEAVNLLFSHLPDDDDRARFEDMEDELVESAVEKVKLNRNKRKEASKKKKDDKPKAKKSKADAEANPKKRKAAEEELEDEEDE
jgi:hypothetical protein